MSHSTNNDGAGVAASLLQLTTQMGLALQGIEDILRCVSPSEDEEGNRVADALDRLSAAVSEQTDTLKLLTESVQLLAPVGAERTAG